MNDRYELLLARPARRALAEELPLKVAAAVWGLINGDMLHAPHRVGKPLHAPYLGLRHGSPPRSLRSSAAAPKGTPGAACDAHSLSAQWVARRSTYRVRYRVDEDKHAVIVLDVRGRADVYHWPS